MSDVRKYFGLTRHAYDKDLAADDLFPPGSLLELNARLTHLIDMRGIGLVTGDSGSGKTTTYRHMVAGLHSGLYGVLYVSMITGNVMDLHKIAWELGAAGLQEGSLPTSNSQEAGSPRSPAAARTLAFSNNFPRQVVGANPRGPPNGVTKERGAQAARFRERQQTPLDATRERARPNEPRPHLRFA